jgi:hypothetical protein
VLIYSQTTGELRRRDELLGTGFSGFEHMKNVPAFEDTLHGPIPKRTWTIFLPRQKGDSWTMALKPVSAPVPRTALGTFSLQTGTPATVSYGCIVMPKETIARVVELWNQGERILKVIA